MNCSLTFELKGHLNSPGFRPLIWKLVSRTELGGWVADSAAGVLLRLEGDPDIIMNFVKSLPQRIPRYYHLNMIRFLNKADLPDRVDQRPFRLIGPVFGDENVLPDRAPCPECIRKMLDPASPFYRFPFVSCKDCGPGFSLAMHSPFIRSMTSLRAFPACLRCNQSGNPFQLCPNCGPNTFLRTPDLAPVDVPDAPAAASALIAEGKIAAVKTFDGFIYLCDPFQPEALRRLRRLNRTPEQPVSLIARDLDMVRRYTAARPEELAELSAPSAPLVIVNAGSDTSLDWNLLCPDDPGSVGITLPPTALIRLLFEMPGKNPFDLLAMIGSSRPVDPETADGDEALSEIAKGADYLLTHEVKIWQIGGPSVIRFNSSGRKHFIRRSRGVELEPVPLDFTLKRNILAMGSDEDSAVALGMRSRIVVSSQIGQIRNSRDSKALYLAGEQLAMIHARVPEMIVCDMDLETFSAREALRLSEKYRLPLATAQRHHANALSCLLEHHLPEANALILDGGASGPDGTVWGGGVLSIQYTSFHQYASFSSIPMELAGYRMSAPALLLYRFMESSGVSLKDSWLKRLNITRAFLEDRMKETESQQTVLGHPALLLLDAAAAAFGISPKIKSHEYQNLLRLHPFFRNRPDESNIRRLPALFQYDKTENDGTLEISWAPFFRNLENPECLEDFSPVDLVYAFAMAMANASADMLEFARAQNRNRNVVLSGKLFICLPLEELFRKTLEKRGFRVYTHEKTSANASSVCIGQALFGGMS